MVQAGAGLPGDARGRPCELLAALHRLIRGLVEIEDTLEDGAEHGIGIDAGADELVVILEFLPRHQARRVAALAAAEGHGVLQCFGELLQHLLSLAAALGDLRVPARVERVDQLVQVHHALRSRVQPSEGQPHASAAVLAHRVVLQGLEELVVGEEAWGVWLHEELEDLSQLAGLHRAAVLGREVLEEHVLEGVVVNGARVLRVNLAEGHGQRDDGSRTKAGEAPFHPHQALLRTLPDLVAGLRAQGHLRAGAAHASAAPAAAAAHELAGELLVGQGTVGSIAVEDHPDVLVQDAGSEGSHRPLELHEVHRSTIAQVVVLEGLHDEVVLAQARRHPLLDLAENDLLQLVQLGLCETHHGCASLAGRGASTACHTRHELGGRSQAGRPG
mmetsp:Transcript_6782/g.17004  ORF Transcript_6782/g.17004 Transcript_6782/m.17004 type:complete len:388 (+) Transcript_6782:1655-2818(+)